MTIARIAVTTDLTPRSRCVFPLAASLGRALRAEIVLVHQVVDIPPVCGVRRRGETESDSRSKLEALGASEFSGLPLERAFLTDGDFRTLAEFLRKEGVGLVCVATHGRRGAELHRFGSFAEGVLEHAPCPVLLYPGAEPAPALSPRSLLVADDFRGELGDDPFVAFALALATACRARVRLLAAPFAEDYPFAPDGERESDDGVCRRRNEIATRAAWLRERYPDVAISAASIDGSPIEFVLAEAHSDGSDLIVLRGHGEAPVDERWRGRTADAIARRSECPVLVVRGDTVLEKGASTPSRASAGGEVGPRPRR
jgi:nucleotide-binding universal stress UspA family protein